MQTSRAAVRASRALRGRSGRLSRVILPRLGPDYYRSRTLVLIFIRLLNILYIFLNIYYLIRSFLCEKKVTGHQLILHPVP